jgi:aconitate hydratase
VNLEYIARGIWSSADPSGEEVAYPDTLVGTDSHTTMVNGLGVLGWGVGGIEAEAAMLGQPVSMLIPEVVGFKLTGALAEGITATDLVLTVTQMLRKKGVVGRFVEFYGPGVSELSLADRATIANMAPEYGATCGFFGIDEKTLDYLRLTGRPERTSRSPRPMPGNRACGSPAACRSGLHRHAGARHGQVEPSLAGPKRPQDKVLLSQVDEEFRRNFTTEFGHPAEELPDRFPVEDAGGGITDAIKGLLGRKPSHDLGHGDVVIAAITSCTNTSNPSVLVAAGLVARKAREKGLDSKPWVKTSLAPGSQVVTDYLDRAGPVGGSERARLRSGRLWLHHLHRQFRAAAGADLQGDPRQRSGCRLRPLGQPQFRRPRLAGRARQLSRLAAAGGRLCAEGHRRRGHGHSPIGKGKDGADVYLRDIWPTNAEVRDMIDQFVNADMFKARYADVYKGDAHWQAVNVSGGATYAWDATSTYIQNPPYFEGMSMTAAGLTDIVDASALAVFGDSITTDHISPAGSIKADSPAGTYLTEHQVSRADFNSYGARAAIMK